MRGPELLLTLPMLLLLLPAPGGAQRTPDEWRNYERFRETMFGRARDRGPADRHLRLLELQGKLQPPWAGAEFPCRERVRSQPRPTSVHRLRPADVDVVAAMGDSLTAGHGNTALTLLQVLVENRGLSFSGGGQGTWREFLTLPNILKEFNPRLVGYARKDALSHQRASEFNVAEGGAWSVDMPWQARNLVKRMRSDPRVDLQNDWKLVTLLIGHNDFCLELCHVADARATARRHRRDLEQALDHLRDHLPRTIVNLLPMVSLKAYIELNDRPAICELTNSFVCPCMRGLAYRRRLAEFVDIIADWQREEIDLTNSPRYRDRDDFAVVLQPFPEHISLAGADGRTDYSLLAPDCLHFSQKSNSYVATSLWNNMLEPVGNKTRHWEATWSRFLCPSESRPFIYTWANSGPGSA